MISEAKLQEMIEAIEGKAERRTVSASDVFHDLNKAEDRLRDLQIPKRAWEGCKVLVMSTDVLPNAYKYAAEWTSVVMVRTKTTWAVEKIVRASSWSKRGTCELVLSDAAKVEIPSAWEL